MSRQKPAALMAMPVTEPDRVYGRLLIHMSEGEGGMLQVLGCSNTALPAEFQDRRPRRAHA